MSKLFERPILGTLLTRLSEPRRFMEVLAGPRQVGKTTLARQALAAVPLPAHSASADELGIGDQAWIAAQWDIGRGLAASADAGAILVLDEIQKIPGWSETVKRLWDEDSAAALELRIVLLGSAPLLMQQGMTESLAGRFEKIRVGHWSFPEMRDAFGWSLDEYILYGGYPGGAPLIGDFDRWASYVRDSLIETTVSRDVLLMTRVDKPALLRQLFRLACSYSGQILSYQKMLGQLTDAGNTVTLAHYLEFLAGAGLVTGLRKYSGSVVRRRGSSPKLLVLNTALMTAQAGRRPEEIRADPALWGRLVETAVGASLAQREDSLTLTYWRDRNLEVDFVIEDPTGPTAIEVTSGAGVHRIEGLEMFTRRFGGRQLLVGGQGISVEEFLLRDK